MSSISIGELEKQTFLTQTQEGTNTLYKFKNIIKRKEFYKAYLLILINGVNAVGTESVYISETGERKTVKISNIHFKRVYRYAQKKEFSLFKSVTPAGKSGAFENYGTEGIVETLTQKNLENNPVTGSSRNTPSLVEYLLNKIHPKFTETLEKYCVAIKSKTYLSLPSMAFGSLKRVVSYLNGVVGAIQKTVFNVYKGVIKAIQQFYAYINGIIVKVQKMLINVIEQIVPLDLICLLLEAVQVIMDDINFFTSLFGQQGSIFNYLNTFQGYLNQVSTLVSNPFTTLNAYIPSEVQNWINTIDEIGFDPSGFLTDQLSNYGYAWAVNALQGDFLGALVNKYGAQYAAIGPIGQLLNSSENYSRNLESPVPTPARIGPNIFTSNNITVDQNFNRDNRYIINNKDMGITE